MDWLPDDPDTCLLLADVVVCVHFSVVAFLLGGQLAILAGWPLRWDWVRGLRFRLLHLGLMVLVAVQSVFGVLCPLTTLENELRWRAGQPLEQASFIGRWLHELLFVDVEPATLAWCYCGFGVLVLCSLFLVPVRWRRERSPSAR